MPIDVGLISDLHLGHVNIAKMRGFEDIDEYNEEIIRRYNSVSGKKTMMIIAGDIAMENSKYYHLLDRMLGRKIVVGGNHDLKQHMVELLKHVEVVVGAYEYRKCIITHVPIHTQEISRFLLNIHGHLHEDIIKRWRYQPGGYSATEEIDKRYFNISWDRLEGIPISFTELIKQSQI
jgi:calcineurin-like phosphoesterase family protein